MRFARMQRKRSLLRCILKETRLLWSFTQWSRTRKTRKTKTFFTYF